MGQGLRYWASSGRGRAGACCCFGVVVSWSVTVGVVSRERLSAAEEVVKGWARQASVGVIVVVKAVGPSQVSCLRVVGENERVNEGSVVLLMKECPWASRKRRARGGRSAPGCVVVVLRVCGGRRKRGSRA